MKKYLFLILILVIFLGCGDPYYGSYTTEYIEVIDTKFENWGIYLHYFAEDRNGLRQIFSDLGYKTIDPPLNTEIIVADVTKTLSRNVIFAMEQHNATYAGTLYIKDGVNKSKPLYIQERGKNVRIDNYGEPGEVFFLLHIRIGNSYYSGVYREEDSGLKWYYIPEWLTPVGPIAP